MSVVLKVGDQRKIVFFTKLFLFFFLSKKYSIIDECSFVFAPQTVLLHLFVSI